MTYGQNEKKSQKETNLSLEDVVITALKQKPQRKNKRKKPNYTNLSKDESVENKNTFLDCDLNDSTCFKNFINQHVLDNFKYPELGSYFDVQAMVYVDYIIDTNGVVGNVSSKAALIGVSFEDVESKNIISGVFEKAANLIIENLPQINGLDFLNNLNQDELLNSGVVENVPIFPGCEDTKESEKRDCFQGKMNQHIMKNFRYPEFAQKNGIQGRVFVQFMIGIDGNISGIRTRGPHGSLERAAERIILLLPKIKPGKRNGLRVRTPFSMPITYRLN